MLFSNLPFSIFSPLPFTLNYSLTARSGRHTTFASTLFLCRKCLKFPSTLQSMRFDSSGGANFRAYRFVEMPPLASGFWRAWNSMLPFSLWGLTPQGLQTLVPTLLLKRSLRGFCNTTLNPCSQKLLFFLSSIRKLSWALAGNFMAWQLQGQISKFWPAAWKWLFS